MPSKLVSGVVKYSHKIVVERTKGGNAPVRWIAGKECALSQYAVMRSRGEPGPRERVDGGNGRSTASVGALFQSGERWEKKSVPNGFPAHYRERGDALFAPDSRSAANEH